MRITIIQTEIEEAIRNHIMSQIQVQEGMEIDIDLRATRGAEGFQADIDIHPKGSGGNKPTKPSTPRGGNTNQGKPLGIEKAVTGAKATGRRSKNSAAQSEVSTPTPTASNEPEDTTEKVDVVLAETPVDTTQIEAAAQAPAEAEAEAPKVSSLFARKTKDEPAQEVASSGEAAPKTQSIFGGLQRPVNA